MSKVVTNCTNNFHVACDFIGWNAGIINKLDEPTSLSEQLDFEVFRRGLNQRGKTISQWTTEEEQLICLLSCGTTVLEHQDDISILEKAARNSNEEDFMYAVEKIDWTQKSAIAFVRAARLALSVGVYLIARRLAERGTKLHPHHTELQKMARIFAPPRLISTAPAQIAVKANDEWLRDHATEYRGQWVAIKAGKLLAKGRSVKELNEQIEDTSDILLTRL